MKKIIVILAAVLAMAALASGQAGEGLKKRRPLPYEYGRVTISNYSERMPPVVFDHWLHRARFTCRVCHIDIGFAMKANATDIKAADNAAGYFCGSCHNGQRAFGDKAVFAACSPDFAPEERRRCDRCHSSGLPVKKEYDFFKFTEKFPKERFGNGIDWEKAEAEKIIKPVDYLEGISIKRARLVQQKEFAIVPKVTGMPDIIFSHKKHNVWNSCELCHPHIFPAVKRGVAKFAMNDIFDAKYCGACHGSVAFPLLDCQRCHEKPVAQ